MTLSLKLRLKRDLDSRSNASSSGFADAKRSKDGEPSSQSREVMVAQSAPRRVTRALARKLQEASPKSVEVGEISPVLGATTPQVKAEEADPSDRSSLSPLYLTVSIQPTVKEEQLDEHSPGPGLTPSRDATALLSAAGLTDLGRACALCGNSAVDVTIRGHSSKFLCEGCLVAFTEQETADQIYERHQRARDDAILLPPPAKHKVANRIVESFKGAEKDFLAKKHESSDFLPPLQLDQSGINFSSYRHLPQQRRHPDSAHVEQMTAVCQIERRPTAPRNFTRSPGGPQRFCPLRRESSPGPYELPLRRYITARADRPFATRSWPSPLLPSMPSNPTA
ncbi:hypothetical protein QFC20_004268 [Naganishia adeliensis]|uniref:Uncharacterized protein n=1 Tax=Naganishia adeliensis TaxID=92952 RepID=A0ACC2W3Y7_9TREE|nr:hypothetical protein QFC20_004268 [Naganishia adeliensis]